MSPQFISARIRAHSKNPYTNTDLITYELVYPRIIHSELTTHRLFSRNAPSSRAIPTPNLISMVRQDPAKPVEWGKNQKGMQSDETLSSNTLVKIPELTGGIIPDDEQTMPPDESNFLPIDQAWHKAAETVADIAYGFYQANVHKQMVNRLIEPFTWMRTVVTATEFDNFFWLRCDSDADPTIRRLAEQMYKAFKASVDSGDNEFPKGALHVPFYNEEGKWTPHSIDYFGVAYDEDGFTAAQALMISASCCAQVSFRKEDNSFEKAQNIYNKLVGSEPVHASPFEHQAWLPPEELTNSPSVISNSCTRLGEWMVNALQQKGITHVALNNSGNQEIGMFADPDHYTSSGGSFDVWSANFRNWIQHRQILDGHSCWDYDSYLANLHQFK